ncbi:MULTISPECIES: FkbM family methyltransferase [Hyphobacterium]|uniref:FkbM family methyltransferase n=1 Tax=Hyphobacterium vulgare TaxID=1736751 RepID=A0ABV6ZVJ3_9PROT
MGLRSRLGDMIRSNERRQRGPTKRQALESLIALGVPVGSVIDVGVQSGTQALIDAFPDRPHLLIEPLAEWNTAIEKTYASAGVSYQLLNEAATTAPGAVTLLLRSVLPGPNVSHAFMVDGDPTGPQYRRVGATTLDAAMRGRDLPAPHLVKVDVDGAEMQVLDGAEETLANASLVILEASVVNLIERGVEMDRRGFQLCELVDFCYYDRRFVQADMIFISRKIIKDHQLEFYRDGFDLARWSEFKV